VALYNYMSQILVELIKLANLIINITKALACAGRIQSIFDVKPGMQDGTAGVRESDDEVPVVEFKNAALKYSGAGDTSIAGVSFKAYRGQTIGIIGGTGSGKSSLVGLIPRFYDATDGEVLIDGVNVKDIRLEELRDKVGIVMQKAVLFKGSIRNNMQVAKQDATDGEIDEALAIAQAKEFVDKKDGRLDYMIEQGGKNLSGGQRQRLTIARAVVKKPDVLILDDSASALDFATDAALRKSIRTMPNNPTVFIVSQRSASLMHADKIIVLDDGNVAGIGTHSELLANCEVYREIYNSQFKSAKGA
jgi:ATP-binding cassette, subfamily C, bacterial